MTHCVSSVGLSVELYDIKRLEEPDARVLVGGWMVGARDRFGEGLDLVLAASP